MYMGPLCLVCAMLSDSVVFVVSEKTGTVDQVLAWTTRTVHRIFKDRVDDVLLDRCVCLMLLSVKHDSKNKEAETKMNDVC